MRLTITINGQRLGDIDAIAVRDALSEHLRRLRAEPVGRGSGEGAERAEVLRRRNSLVRVLTAMGVAT